MGGLLNRAIEGFIGENRYNRDITIRGRKGVERERGE
jgi:hypothetical protein